MWRKLTDDMTALEVEGSMRRSVSVHFRISTDMYDSLEEEARKKSVSLNTLLNQVISAHTRDDLLFEEEGFVKMTKNTLCVVLSLIQDDKLQFRQAGGKEGRRRRILARSKNITPRYRSRRLRLFS